MGCEFGRAQGMTAGDDGLPDFLERRASVRSPLAKPRFWHHVFDIPRFRRWYKCNRIFEDMEFWGIEWCSTWLSGKVVLHAPREAGHAASRAGRATCSAREIGSPF
jgi:hypothetical protein